MSESVLFEILRNLKVREAKAQELLFRYGDEGDSFFVILKGTVGVLVSEEQEKA